MAALLSSKLNMTARPAPAQRPSVRTNAVALKPLPYAPDALEPHMSKATFEVRLTFLWPGGIALPACVCGPAQQHAHIHWGHKRPR
eukprot:1161353-Pelagomonas_calceolata.AAC.1